VPAAAPADARARDLLAALGDDACDRDALAARCRLQPAEVAALLTQLEIDGHVAVLPGGLIQRVRR
jgi:DNA processing protein